MQLHGRHHGAERGLFAGAEYDAIDAQLIDHELNRELQLLRESRRLGVRGWMMRDYDRVDIDLVQHRVARQQRPAIHLDATTLCSDVERRRTVLDFSESDWSVQQRARHTTGQNLTASAFRRLLHDPDQCGLTRNHPYAAAKQDGDGDQSYGSFRDIAGPVVIRDGKASVRAHGSDA